MMVHFFRVLMPRWETTLVVMMGESHGKGTTNDNGRTLQLPDRICLVGRVLEYIYAAMQSCDCATFGWVGTKYWVVYTQTKEVVHFLPFLQVFFCMCLQLSCDFLGIFSTISGTKLSEVKSWVRNKINFYNVWLKITENNTTKENNTEIESKV